MEQREMLRHINRGETIIKELTWCTNNLTSYFNETAVYKAIEHVTTILDRLKVVYFNQTVDFDVHESTD